MIGSMKQPLITVAEPTQYFSVAPCAISEEESVAAPEWLEI